MLKYQATAVNGLVADVGAQVSSAQLANQGTRAAQNASYVNLVGQNIAANQPISIKLANIPAAGSACLAPGVEAPAARACRRSLLAIVGLVGVAAGVLIAVPLARRRTAATGGSSGSVRPRIVVG